MSQNYEIDVEIFGLDPSYTDDVMDAICEAWPAFRDVADDVTEATIEMYGARVELNTGMSTAAVADNIAQLVWKANKGPCEVNTTLTNMDSPSEIAYSRAAADYKAWKEAA